MGLGGVLGAALVISALLGSCQASQPTATLLGHSFRLGGGAELRWPLGCEGQGLVRLQLSFSAGGNLPPEAGPCSATLSVSCAGSSCRGLVARVEGQVGLKGAAACWGMIGTGRAGRLPALPASAGRRSTPFAAARTGSVLRAGLVSDRRLPRAPVCVRRRPTTQQLQRLARQQCRRPAAAAAAAASQPSSCWTAAALRS